MDVVALVQHVAATTGLDPSVAARLVEDVVGFFAETTEDYVRRRHRELKTRGLKNPDIWRTIGAELDRRVVAPPPLTGRQLRRIVYG
jgi:hypothetical protein